MTRFDVTPRDYKEKTNIILLINLPHRCIVFLHSFSFFCQGGIGVMSPPLPSTHQVYLNNSENYEVRLSKNYEVRLSQNYEVRLSQNYEVRLSQN